MVKTSFESPDGENNSHPEENGDSKDCHNIVKSSGVGRRKRQKVCCSHKAGGRRLGKVSVACQTERAEGEASSSAPLLDLEATRSEGTLRLMIQNFRNMTDTVRGPGKVISGVPWKIMVMPRQHVVAKKGQQKCLGFFLQCCPDSYSDSWSCQASAELRLISQNPAVSNFVRKTTHLYTAKENDWGYSCFMTWADILEESQGYMKDEKVILEVYVKADPPKGILTHDAFCKKIEDYMRLADMQSSRGLIDKAIEVNQTAVKFCKDKDATMKTELENQKARLIEQKLKQSIERIEKGTTNGGPDNLDDPAANLNTLRNAIKADFSGLKGPPPPPPPPAAFVATDPAKKVTTPKVKPKNEANEIDVVNLPKEEMEAEKETEAPVSEGHEEEASFSGESDDDGDGTYSEDEEGDEDYCDSCLQAKLETISGEDVQTAEFCCQTELGRTELKKERILSQLKEGDIGGRWTSERESELLELITKESRASLDSIRDTLERLVSLAKDGEVPAGLELDLQALKEEQRERDLLSADFVEIPSVDLQAPPASGDVAPPLPPPNPPTPTMPKARPAKNQSLLSRGGLGGAGDTESILGDLSPEEQELVAKAKGLVQAKAEELMTKYSQLIQQSEAMKLAETVKKVEKRMKDIEKQTMTCRKELSDECERHCKEEAKLVKANRGLKAQVDAATERAEKANAQLKERKAELKRLEKRLKSEGQLQETNSELESRVATLEKELSESKHRCNESTKRLCRESEKLAETKKSFQAELASASADIERLNQQVEERKAQIKKLESRLDSERRSHNNSLRDAVDRAKKAEINLLEFKLEMGLKLLERAQEDCQNNINHLDEIQRRKNNPKAEELKPLRAYMSDWERTRERIGDLMGKARADFGSQIEAVKSGKPLTQLPAIEVAKPPPPPQAPKFSPQQARPASNEGVQAVISHKAPPAPIGRPATTNGGTPTNNNPGDVEPFLPPMAAPQPSSIPPPFPPPPPLKQGMQTPPPSQASDTAAAISNGFSPWSDPLGPLTESLFPGQRTMQLGGIGFGDSWNSSSISALGAHLTSASKSTASSGSSSGSALPTSNAGQAQFRNPPPSSQPPAPGPPGVPPPAFPPYNLSQPPPSLHGAGPGSGLSALAGGSGAQWGGGWGYPPITSAPPPSIHSPNPHHHATPTSSSQTIRPLSRLSGSPGAVGSVGGGIESGGRGSPKGSGGAPRQRVETLMESLQATFPSFSQEALRDYVNEYRQYQPNALKGLSVQQALNAVVAFIMTKNTTGSWKPDGKGGLLSSGGGGGGLGGPGGLDSFKYAPSPDEYPALT